MKLTKKVIIELTEEEYIKIDQAQLVLERLERLIKDCIDEDESEKYIDLFEAINKACFYMGEVPRIIKEDYN